MKNTCIFFIIFIFFSAPGFSHPLDISYTTIQIKDDTLFGTTFIHPYELSLLSNDNNLKIETITFRQLQQILVPYFKKHFRLYSKKGQLSFTDISIQESELFEIIASGVYVLFSIHDYGGPASPITFQTDLFIEYFSTQTNKIVLLDDHGSMFPGGEEIILTGKNMEWTFDPKNPDFTAFHDPMTDTDKDGLTDKFESYYGLNPYSADTDGDGWSDFEEFNAGWDPLDPRPSPGQPRLMDTDYPDSETAVPDSRITDNTGIVNNNSSTSKQHAAVKNLIQDNNLSNSALSDSSLLKGTLQKMKDIFSREYEFHELFSFLFLVFILGIIHASMPGHAKGILIAYFADKDKSILQALGFIITFTFTHLIDVIILSFGFSIFASAQNSSAVTEIIKIVGGLGLVAVAVYMIIAGIIRLVKKQPEEAESDTRQKKKAKFAKSAFLLGLLAGLIPCPFGWALLMMLLSIGKTELVPLVISVFGLGIFTFMLACVLTLSFLKKAANLVFNRFARFSGLISGILLLLFSILLFFPQFNIF